eukprot:215914-Pyramimonas_sp.AAC.2
MPYLEPQISESNSSGNGYLHTRLPGARFLPLLRFDVLPGAALHSLKRSSVCGNVPTTLNLGFWISCHQQQHGPRERTDLRYVDFELAVYETDLLGFGRKKSGQERTDGVARQFDACQATYTDVGDSSSTGAGASSPPNTKSLGTSV